VRWSSTQPGLCRLCGAEAIDISRSLGLCRDCILQRFGEARPRIEEIHRAARRPFDLPEAPPRTPGGVTCPLCHRACRIGPDDRGFCGLRTGVTGRSGQHRLRHLAGIPARGLLQWYRDPLPTNCVAAWVCGGSHRRGKHNLAVFYCSCTVSCLFCQNWHFREIRPQRSTFTSAAELAGCANDDTYCVCYFGGDPASQMPHALRTSHRLAERGIAICWETAGTQCHAVLDEAVSLSLASGGIVKVDLKAFQPGLHRALTGADNRQILHSFARIARRSRQRPEPPLVVASTLLVPGYVTPDEVGRIARFIAGIDPDTPYSLLAFYPQFLMADQPVTSRQHAEQALAAARDAGLTRVHIGNRHLLL
jgi:pyruvate formate lyase activating enzyme